VLGGIAMKPHYLLLLVIILCIDVLGAIPFANLRFKKRPVRFAMIKIINVVLTILLNLFFFLA
ncbi:MAG TPA: polysaccharide biosynthesis protein, partial [Rikenellaceae bacterium]|nr:polysaccharide biosynthesis protein [Rikenellaceae bacterium]